ncbi:MAG: 4Fe-4S binding protein [Acidobacteria bacterium]|nr:4Fe-4S binding protein [Acidobacteriota bacterium]
MASPSLKLEKKLCISCGICMDICPHQAIDMTRTSYIGVEGDINKVIPAKQWESERKPKSWMMEYPCLVFPEKCTRCDLCVRECPVSALSLT